MSKIDEHYREREELGLGDGYSDGTEGYVFKEHSDKMKKKKKIIIEIDVHKMVTWFWGSRDEREQLACQVIEEIQEGGRCEITYQTASDSLGYIPAHATIFMASCTIAPLEAGSVECGDSQYNPCWVKIAE